MRLFIKDTQWAINRVTGKRTTRVLFDGEVPCEVGAVEAFQEKYSEFYVDEVGENSVTLSIRYPNNPDGGKVFIIEKGEDKVYAPRSFGAGHVYDFRVE